MKTTVIMLFSIALILNSLTLFLAKELWSGKALTFFRVAHTVGLLMSVFGIYLTLVGG